MRRPTLNLVGVLALANDTETPRGFSQETSSVVLRVTDSERGIDCAQTPKTAVERGIGLGISARMWVPKLERGRVGGGIATIHPIHVSTFDGEGRGFPSLFLSRPWGFRDHRTRLSRPSNARYSLTS
jgi:hypothetical protein